MALRLGTAQVGVGAVRLDFPSSATSAGSTAHPSAARSYGGAAVCMQGQALKPRLSSSVQQEESLSSLSSSSYQSAHPVRQRQGSSTRKRRDGIFINDVAPSSNSSALIDIEDGADGSVTFKYGAVEDLWDLDRLLEFLCSGAFSIHTAESFVPLIIELFSVPVSHSGQRRMTELLSSYIRLGNNASTEEMVSMVSQALAEAAAEFLPPSNVGCYAKGRARPGKRFSSRQDKWWRKLDNYLGVGEGSVDFLPEESLACLDGNLAQPSWSYEKWNRRSSYDPLKPEFSPTLNRDMTKFIWEDAPASWLSTLLGRLSLEAPKDSAVDGISSSRFVEGGYIPGVGFVLRSSQVNTLEELRKTETEKNGVDPDLHFASPLTNLEALPTSSIQDMVEWEQEDSAISCVSLPSISKPRVKVHVKKTTQKTRTRTTHRVRGNTSSTKQASKKNSTSERRKDSQVCDMFFALPPSHKYSGVASFLTMRRNFSGELPAVLNYVAVGLAAAGLATTLHVGARMLSLNATFDSSKLFGIIRGGALLWLSAAIQSLRKVMLRLPTVCTVSDIKDKTVLLCLQQQLRKLSMTALTVVLLTVVGNGF